MGSVVLLDLMGGVALLLWGLHMVHSGILRAFGPDLRLLLAKALNNRFKAFAAGIGLTALLQSSTATALITSSFTAEGLVSLAAQCERNLIVGVHVERSRATGPPLSPSRTVRVFNPKLSLSIRTGPGKNVFRANERLLRSVIRWMSR